MTVAITLEDENSAASLTSFSLSLSLSLSFLPKPNSPLLLFSPLPFVNFPSSSARLPRLLAEPEVPSVLILWSPSYSLVEHHPIQSRMVNLPDSVYQSDSLKKVFHWEERGIGIAIAIVGCSSVAWTAS